MKELTLMNKFNECMKESIIGDYRNHAKDINENCKYYYDNSYSVNIFRYFVKRGFNSKELSFKNNCKNLPICSISSSARLCLLYFLKNHKNDDFYLEQSYPILKKDGKTLTNAHPDAILGNTYYECKAQEVVNGENEKLRESYLTSAKYFKEFFYDEKKISTNNGCLDFGMDALGVDIKKKYYDLKLDIKQLICHLLSIANVTDKTNNHWTLKYLIFRPSRRYDNEVKQIYDELDSEFNSILNSKNKIIEFCNSHKITIVKDYVYMDELDEGVVNNIL